MLRPFRETALPLLFASYSPIPIIPGTKRPALAGWQRLCGAPLSTDEIEHVTESPIAYGVGVALGFNGLIAIDVDRDDPALVAAIHPVLPTSIVAKRGRRGWTAFCHDPGGSIRTRHFCGMVDVLARGSQTVLPPSLHPDTGQPYHWIGEATLWSTPVSALPIISPDIVERLAAALSPWLSTARRPALELHPTRLLHLSQFELDRQRRYAEIVLAAKLSELAAMGIDTGRNCAAFRLVCRIGRWVHHGIVPSDRVTADVLHACERNGLVRDHGRRALLATIASGLTKSAGDRLPYLGARYE